MTPTHLPIYLPTYLPISDVVRFLVPFSPPLYRVTQRVDTRRRLGSGATQRGRENVRTNLRISFDPSSAPSLSRATLARLQIRGGGGNEGGSSFSRSPTREGSPSSPPSFFSFFYLKQLEAPGCLNPPGDSPAISATSFDDISGLCISVGSFRVFPFSLSPSRLPFRSLSPFDVCPTFQRLSSN